MEKTPEKIPAEKTAEKPRPILSVRPKFDSFQTILEAAPIGVAGVFATTMLGGTLFLILSSLIGLGQILSAGGIFSFFFLLGLVVVPPLFYEMKKNAYQRTAYHFFDGYLEFQDFLLYFKRRRGRIRYSDITDVTQSANMVQERQKLKTVHLFVPAMGYQARGGFVGLKMPDLPEGLGVGTRIMDIIHGQYAAPEQPAIEVKSQT